MKSLFSKVALVAMLSAMTNLVPLMAEDREAAGPVPTRADGNNPDSDVYRASDVINLPVKNNDGAEVGRIKDLVINGNSREVLYAVVAMNDAKQKDSLYVMPWNVFQPNYGQLNAIQYTVLTIPQNIWMQAPFYSTSQWRQTPYSQWGPRVNNYFAEHNSGGRSGGAGSTAVRVNKPNLDDDKSKNSDSPKNSPDKSNDKNKESTSEKAANQPAADKPSTKPATNPATEASKPEVKPNAPAPKPNPPQSAAPKESKPAEPKGTTPREPK